MKGTVNIQIFKGTHVKKKTKSAWSIWNPRHLDQQMKALVWIVVQCGFGQSPVSIWICDVNPYVSSLKFKSQRCSYTRCINLSSCKYTSLLIQTFQMLCPLTAIFGSKALNCSLGVCNFLVHKNFLKLSLPQDEATHIQNYKEETFHN